MKLLFTFTLLAASPFLACADKTSVNAKHGDGPSKKNYLRALTPKSKEKSMSSEDGAGEDVREGEDIMPPMVEVPPEAAFVQPTIADLAADTEDLSTLLSILQQLELDDDLAVDGPFTVFAPNDKAFDKLDLSEEEVAQSGGLENIVTYHVVSGEYRASELEDGDYTLPTLQGATLEIEKKGDKVKVNGVKVKIADIEAANGIVHIIEKVLTPPADTTDTTPSADTIDTTPSADTAATTPAVLSNDEDEDEDEEEGQTPPDTLPILPTTPTTPGNTDAAEISKEAESEGGMDSPMGEDNTTGNSMEDEDVTDDMDAVTGGTAKNIVDIATTTEEVSTLVSVLNEDLVSVLRDGTFTVFAPTNEAFEDEELSVNDETLAQIIKYHVVAGKLTAEDLSDKDMVETVQGESVKIKIKNDMIEKVNKAKVIDMIDGSNGVIYLIDKVLIPDMEEAETAAPEEPMDEPTVTEEQVSTDEGDEATFVLPTTPSATDTSTVSIGEDCNKSIPTLEDKGDPNFAEPCVSSCECADGCCIAWSTKNVCAPPLDSEGLTGGFNTFMSCIQSFSN